ncbi:MAG: hypothetical protein HY322_04545 [Betaproteobacteria bacterium]|nr:hypothetical protein [Betaproteobacteria bacterium]
MSLSVLSVADVTDDAGLNSLLPFQPRLVACGQRRRRSRWHAGAERSSVVVGLGNVAETPHHMLHIACSA